MITGKRIFDLLASFFLLIFLSPVFLLLAVLISRKLGRPVFFTQERPGFKGKIFPLIKFRTMNNDRDEHGNLLPDERRLTPFGNSLRRLSLDEIPELFNVLKGEMSLVGPRPLLKEYLELYDPEQMRRHEVKPGITGWAQINGRNAISWEEKFKLDIWYVDHQNFRLDLKIIFLTILIVLGRKGINYPGQATMDVFKGKTGKNG